MSEKLKNSLIIAIRLVRYNMKVVFAGKFWLFVLSAVLFFLVFGTIKALNDSYFMLNEVYGLLLFPALLLIFYPTVFGIQNDADMRTLEIIFGIPDYRYKVWLVRLVMVFLIVFALLFPLSYLAQTILIDFNILSMSLQLMVVVFFVGGLSFMVSTIVRNGNGAAVIIVIIALLFFILGDALKESMWNIFLNPYRNLDGIRALLWEEKVTQNRIFMLASSVVFILFGLLNLQNREKFLR